MWSYMGIKIQPYITVMANQPLPVTQTSRNKDLNDCLEIPNLLQVSLHISTL